MTVVDLASYRARREQRVRILADLIRLRIAGADIVPFLDLLSTMPIFAGVLG